MAFGIFTVWEVRGTGDNTNGGGFDSGVAAPGTDYSLQDAAQFVYTDLVIDAVTNTKITSAAFPFDATCPGNIINITGGVNFTVQRVEVLSVAGNVATCDKAVGTVGATGGAGKLGGALADPGQAFAVWVAQNIIYLKRQAGDAIYGLSNTANVAGGRLEFDNPGTSATNTLSQLIGYDVNRTQWNTDSPPTLKPTADSFHAIIKLNANYCRAHNIKIRNPDTHTAANYAAVELWGGYNIVSRIDVDLNNATNWFSVFYFNSNSTYAFQCIANHSNAVGFFNNAGNVVGLYACAALNITSENGFSGPFRCFYCLAYNCSGAIFDGYTANSAAGAVYHNCVSYQSGRHGFALYYDSHAINCIAVNNVGYGFDTVAIGNAAVTQLLNPATFGNGSGAVKPGDFGGSNLTGAVALTGDPFTNAAGGDFSLNNTAGAGAACKAVGFPSNFFGLSTNSFPDIGMAQSKGAAPVTPITGTYVTLTSNLNPSKPGDSVTFTATLTVVGGAGPATGTVQFNIDGVAFGPAVTLAAGVATSQATTTLASGTRSITAVYTPSGNFRASTGTLSQVVYTALPVTPLFCKNWNEDKEGFAQELARLFNQDPILSASVDVIKTVLPTVL